MGPYGGQWDTYGYFLLEQKVFLSGYKESKFLENYKNYLPTMNIEDSKMTVDLKKVEIIKISVIYQFCKKKSIYIDLIEFTKFYASQTSKKTKMW